MDGHPPGHSGYGEDIKDQKVFMMKPKLNSAVPANLPKRGTEVSGAGGKTVPVQLNTFELRLDNAVDFIHKHELIFIVETEKGKQFVLHTKAGHDVIVQTRRAVLRDLIQLVRDWHAADLGLEEGKDQRYSVVYDGGCSVFLADMCPEFSGDIEKESIPQSLFDLNRFTAKVSYVFKWVEKIALRGAENSPTARQFLDVLTSAKMVDKKGHIVFGNKAYSSSSSSDSPLGNGRDNGITVAKEGCEKSVRQVGNTMCLQMDSKCSPFFSAMSLIDYCQSFCALTDVGHNNQLKKFLRRLVVETIHLGSGKERRFEVQGITKDDADNLTFEVDGNRMSVSQYFEEKYKTRLRYPKAGLIIEKRGANHSYHPMEVLKVVKGQRVPNSKSSPAMIESLIKKAQKTPHELVQAITKQQYRAYLDGTSNEYLAYFGIELKKCMTVAEGTELAMPDIKYGPATPQPDRQPEKWKLNNVRYTVGAKQTGIIYCLVFDRCMDLAKAELAMRKLIDLGRSHGMMLDMQKVKVQEIHSEYGAVGEFAESVKGQAQAIIGLTAADKDEVHDILKTVEMKTGIVTQHCTRRIIEEVAQGKPMGANNILLKFNQKLGGVNHTIAAPTAIRNTPLAPLSRSWFAKTRMFFGLFVSHAAPQSLPDRLAGVPQSEPTIVGFSYTTTGATKQQGTHFMQEPGKQMIGDMKRYIVAALQQFHKETGALPEDIVVYRNGKSDGEFAQIREEEGRQFEAACREVSSLSRSMRYAPTVTIIAVLRNSNYRLFTKGDRPDNVTPGTCVGGSGTNPDLKEFVLVAQRAIKGTSRPTRYTVVYEKQGQMGKVLTVDEIKVISNALAYASGIVCSPISIPAPLDSAEKLANRCANNYKFKTGMEDDASTVSSSNSGGPSGAYRNDGNPEFFSKLSAEFGPKLKLSQFWA